MEDKKFSFSNVNAHDLVGRSDWLAWQVAINTPLSVALRFSFE